MAQITIDGEYAKEFENAKQIVSEFLSKCERCRNDDKHLVQHVWTKNPNITPETITRARRKLQNTYGLFLANKTTQEKRQAKEKFMRDNIKKL